MGETELALALVGCGGMGLRHLQGLAALELEDFGRAIQDRRAPELDGHGGLAAVALIHAFFESSLAGREVTLEEVTGGAVEAYQHEIDVVLGLTEEGIVA